MKITKKELKLKVPTNKYLPGIQDEIRENLMRMGVDGISVDIRYDARSNIVLTRFSFKGKNHEMKVDNQKDIRANMWAIAKRIEYKARMHLLGIEPFEISMSPYLQIENISGIQSFDIPKATAKSYTILGLAEYSSNEEIIKKYRELVKSFHPDMALSQEAKKEFQNKINEINQAYDEIKKERGIK